MKKIYLFAFTFIGSLLWAQVHISFEQNEGYTLGNLHNQNGWEVTESSDGLVENQVISDEYASEGSFSFKNGNEPDYDFQWFPIFGGAFEFESPISSEVEFSISYDVRVTGQNGADFEFTLYGINEEFQYFDGNSCRGRDRDKRRIKCCFRGEHGPDRIRRQVGS